MVGKFLGISAGMALGAAVFAAPASASLVLESDMTTDVGSVDLFLGACEADGGGISVEVACINAVTGFSFTSSDALKMDDLTAGFFEAVDSNGVIGDENLWAIELEKQGGWFSVKTGNISCTSAADAFLAFGATCNVGVDDQYFLIFENLTEFLYGVFDLDNLGSSFGFGIDNIGKFSHITIVPLPGAALLFGSALLGGGLMRRRKMIAKFGLPS